MQILDHRKPRHKNQRYNICMEELLRLPPVFDPPLMNAAGMLGFAPDRRKPLDWEKFGAFVTNPVSVSPRRPAAGARWRQEGSTALVHTGHPNPGFSRVVRQYASVWAQSDLPVVVHLMADRPAEMKKIIPRLEVLENILAVELGFPEEIGQGELVEAISACLGELPLIVQLPFSRAVLLAPAVIEAGAAAVSLAPPRGQLPDAVGDFDRGRLYGPPLFSQALHVVRRLDALQIPVIGAGGVYSREQANVMRWAGAFAVQVDLALWRGDWLLAKEEEE